MEFKGMLRRIAGAGMALAVAGAMAIAPASATAAQDGVSASTEMRILHASTRACLDSDHLGKVYTLKCNGGLNQRWDNYTSGKFRNVATNLCLGGARSGGGTLYTFTGECSDPRTTWTTTPGSPRKFRNAQLGLCMDGPGGSPEGVGLKDCDAANRWSIAA
ncbi:ricin-type beta-trefoil lectin domain protein [Lentzea sp. CC55]|uniref:RICIN domain-containing protein n=1 Tax=Lentzea sp. CC55 TaxID=2884909 RepID=UPI001F3F8C89|nr:ricin-type beta-trefoil lectin domain protein [Lentzea sp. CC55]MCG8927384.1 RICIN domain-containing protein [Lentzea sp. CC55]